MSNQAYTRADISSSSQSPPRGTRHNRNLRIDPVRHCDHHRTAAGVNASSVCARSASRSSMCSSPALKRMKPSGTASPPQRARRSAQVHVPPKLVASVIQLRRSEEGLRRSLVRKIEAQHRAEVLHLPLRHVVPRMPRQPWIQHARHLGPRHQVLGNPLRIRATAFQRRSSSVLSPAAWPRLHRPQHSANQRSPLLDLLQQLAVARSSVVAAGCRCVPSST